MYGGGSIQWHRNNSIIHKNDEFLLRLYFWLSPEMSWGESFCLHGPSIWMSDVFIEEWLAPRKSRWILHSAFKSNGMQISGFRAVPGYLCCLGRQHQLCGRACTLLLSFFPPPVLLHMLQFRFKSCACCLQLNIKRLNQQPFIIFGCSQTSLEKETERESENLVLHC